MSAAPSVADVLARVLAYVEARFGVAFDACAVPMGITDLQGGWLDVNAAFAPHVGDEGRGATRALVRDERGAPIAILLTVEPPLADVDAGLRAIVDAAPVAGAVLDGSGRVAHANAALSALLGAPVADLRGRPWPDLLAPGPVVSLRDAGIAASVRLLAADGTSRAVRARTAPTSTAPGGPTPTSTAPAGPTPTAALTVAWLEPVSDAEDPRSDAVRRDERLQVAARMARVVAHDLNNAMSVVVNHARMAQRAAGLPPRAFEHLERLHQGTARAAALSKLLQRLGGPHAPAASPTDAGAALDALLARLRAVGGDGVDVRLRRDPALPSVALGPSALEDVLGALVANARDAGATRVTVEASGAGADGRPEPAALRLVVADDGEGMHPATLDAAFDPWFTTRTPRNRGLGLPLAWVTVRGAGGTLRVDSAPGRGTAVTIELPAVHAPAFAAPAAAPRSPRPARVLVVDDEAELCGLMVDVLRSGGYLAEGASNAEAVLGRIADDGSPIELLVSDVVMPRVDGPELCRRARAVRPDLPVLLVSGQPRSDALKLQLSRQEVQFLPKPFDPEDLLEAVGKALG